MIRIAFYPRKAMPAFRYARTATCTCMKQCGNWNEGSLFYE
jgi:hypothetical protein